MGENKRWRYASILQQINEKKPRKGVNKGQSIGKGEEKIVEEQREARKQNGK